MEHSQHLNLDVGIAPLYQLYFANVGNDRKDIPDVLVSNTKNDVEDSSISSSDGWWRLQTYLNKQGCILPLRIPASWSYHNIG